MKGMRVQSIIRELRGEKIDIIEFSEDPVVFATHALSPAKISRIAVVDAVEKHMEVIVDDSQLSLAIGKRGQNVRLAAKLLGWRIDIKSEEEKRLEVESAMAALVVPGAPVSALLEHGLGDTLMETLLESGVTTVEKLGSMTPEQLEEIPGIGPEMVERIQIAVNNYYSQFEGAVAEPPAEEAAAGEEHAAGEAAADQVPPANPEGVAETAGESAESAEPVGEIQLSGQGSVPDAAGAEPDPPTAGETSAAEDSDRI
jgi:N utilization substance protein A